MKVKLILVCIWLFVWAHTSSGVALQGPAGEVINRPPPVDEQAAARAQQAARLRKQAAIRDQFELALKSGNAAQDRAFHAMGLGGSESVQKQSFAEAETNYQRAAKLQPRDWRAFSGLGMVYSWQRRYGDSILAYKRATALRPNDAKLFELLARSYGSNKQLAEKRSALERSIQLDPSTKNYDYMRYTDLAGSYDDAKLYDKAIASYKRLLANLPSSNVERIVDTHLDIGRVYEHSNRLPQAIEEYEQVKKLDGPHSSRADDRIGDAYGQAEQYDKAAEAFKRATEIDPKDGYAFGALGYAYYLQKQYAMSLNPFQRAILLHSHVEEGRYYSGLAQLMLGHKSEAMEQYEELKKLKSDFADKLLSEINKH
jgi:tetratricopeptide (TPR) repeat protein